MVDVIKSKMMEKYRGWLTDSRQRQRSGIRQICGQERITKNGERQRMKLRKKCNKKKQKTPRIKLSPQARCEYFMG